jgi:hypothetical protein
MTWQLAELININIPNFGNMYLIPVFSLLSLQ